MNRRDPLDGDGGPAAGGDADGSGLDAFVYGGRPPLNAAVGRTIPPSMEAVWAASVAAEAPPAHGNHGPAAGESSNPSSTPAEQKPLSGRPSDAHSLKWAPFGYEILPASEAGTGSGGGVAHGDDGPSGGGGGGGKRSGKCSYGSDRGLVCVSSFPPELTPRVSLSRSLIRSNDGGVHRWNKSWLFPEVTVRVDPVPATASATSVQVLVVTSPANPSADGPATAAGGSEGTVENAGLGTSDTSRVVRPCRQQTLVNGEAIFTRLRLRATSYALGGRRFSLVVVLFDARGAVLSSIVSSPFLVHARIDGAPPRCRWSTPRTRRSSRSGAYNFSAFDVDTFSRVYVKKSSVKGNGAASTVEEVIDNSAVGLLRYFTAPNIRNKSRHPLLLVVRFSAALLLSRDVERYPVFDDDAATAFIAACGTVLPNAVDRDAGVPGVETTPLVPWILSLRSPAGAVGASAGGGGAGGSGTGGDIADAACSEARAVLRLRDMLGNLRGPAVGWVADATVLPPRYTETADTGLMQRVYTRLRALADAAGPVKEPIVGGRGSIGGGGGGRLPRKRPPSGSADDSVVDRKPPRQMLPPSVVGEQSHYAAILGRVPPSGSGGCSGSPRGATHHAVAAEVAVLDGGTEFNPRLPIHCSFDAAFRKCHSLLNGVADALQQEATAAFSSGIQDNGRGLVIALKAMKAALRGHHLEEKLLYDALRSRTPGVCESYVIDQLRSVERLDELDVMIRSVVADVNKLSDGGPAGAPAMGAELFMKSSHFTRLIAEKCSKEEDHLLPYFFRRFSLPELSNLLYVLEVSLAEAVTREREAAASESQSGERASGRF
ncbi:hypothetical protein I4F81_011478 [Pyropia yezoensis]|uniref:Uncharacterized protein n=1 Tax=Pyropia yezoensis TaxID=2788 RepID=A0ACC3CFF3_PYRYE|nr:hypothetical protein I4F81_011478 [Neopyropia yezoensis]